MLLRCGFYGFALTQLNVMPSVHSGRFSKKYIFTILHKRQCIYEQKINSNKIYILRKELLLRCIFYDFALTQLKVMPSVHSGRFSEIHFNSIIFKLKSLWATTFFNSISNHRSVLGLFCTIYVSGQIYLFKVKYILHH